MHVHHPLPGIVVQVQAAGCAVASIGEEQIDRAVVVLDRLTKAGHCGFVSHVQANAACIAVDRFGDFDSLIFVKISDNDKASAFSGEGVCAGAADAAAAAGDYTDSII